MAAPRSGRTRSAERRRQRSVRVTVAVALLAVATGGVAIALPTQSPTFLSIAAVAAIALGWAAVRIVWTEVLQTRREHAVDRAATATAYRDLFTERAAEHAEFTTTMTERLAATTMSVRELQGALLVAQRDSATQQLRAERAEDRVAELERSIEVLRSEHEQIFGSSEPSVADLMEFDERVAAATQPGDEADAKLA